VAGTVNKQIILDYVGANPDIRRTQDGKKVATFSIATSESWKDKVTGEKKESTDWHRVVVFNENLVNVVESYVKKGSKLYVEGKSRTRKYDDKGIEKTVTECILADFGGTLTLLDSKERVPDADNQDQYGYQDEVPPKQLNDEFVG
jgi:single-strand DNA-binding protein